MRMTTSSEYALLALLYLARRPDEGYIPLYKIAEDQKLPFKYLEHIMHTMGRAKILTSLKGKNGGYKLARPADSISVAQIIRLFDGPLAPVESVSVYFYKSTVIEREKDLTRLLKEIRDFIAYKLENTTLADLI